MNKAKFLFNSTQLYLMAFCISCYSTYIYITHFHVDNDNRDDEQVLSKSSDILLLWYRGYSFRSGLVVFELMVTHKEYFLLVYIVTVISWFAECHSIILVTIPITLAQILNPHKP